MNYKLFILLIVSSNILGQTGDITFTNNLSQSIHYEYTTILTTSLPKIIIKPGHPGMRILGRGDVPANAKNFNVNSSVRSEGQNVWGDAINFTLSRNANDSQAFAINQLGVYTIGIDSNNKLTLTKN